MKRRNALRVLLHVELDYWLFAGHTESCLAVSHRKHGVLHVDICLPTEQALHQSGMRCLACKTMPEKSRKTLPGPKNNRKELLNRCSRKLKPQFIPQARCVGSMQTNAYTYCKLLGVGHARCAKMGEVWLDIGCGSWAINANGSSAGVPLLLP